MTVEKLTPAEAIARSAPPAPPPPRRDAAAILGALQWLKQQIKKVEEEAKAVADVTFPDEAVAGVYAGQVVSTTKRITRKPNDPFDVTDQAAFTAWIAERWPTEIVETVNPAFLANTLYANAVEHDGVIVDVDGEVCPHAELAEPIEFVATYLKKAAAAEALAPLLSMPLDKLADFIAGTDDSDLS